LTIFVVSPDIQLTVLVDGTALCEPSCDSCASYHFKINYYLTRLL